MTVNSEKPKTVPAAAAPVKKTRVSKLAVAVHRINGVIEPGTALYLTAKDYNELLDLEAIRDPSESEEALFEKNPETVVRLRDVDDDIDAVLG